LGSLDDGVGMVAVLIGWVEVNAFVRCAWHVHADR
jgi:hypothetical protein